jgi:predicted nuclease of predicted toxin-antitoxin system
MSLSLLCDEHIPYQVVKGLRRRGIDAITAQQIHLRSALDEVVLDSARQQGRVVYTNDADFLRLHSTGIQHSGILYHHILDYSIGEAIRVVALACEVLSIDEMRNRVEFL